MAKRSGAVGNSTEELERLLAVVVWAADCSELALHIFEERHPTDMRPREAVAAEGVRQAQHILGPAVYAALALEAAEKGDTNVGDDALQRAVETAPPQVRYLLSHLPQPQAMGKSRLSQLFFTRNQMQPETCSAPNAAKATSGLCASALCEHHQLQP